MSRCFVITFILFHMLISFSSTANLLISPTRIEFDDRQRVAKVILINSGSEYKTYRLEWQEKIAQAQGGYKTLANNIVNPQALSQMIRMSPSQVRLAPGERQIVKLALRKPKGLVANEYRSHLLLKALPNDEQSSNNAGIGVNVNFILSYSIPIILRQGTLVNPEVNIDDIKLVKNEVKQVDSIELLMSRSGKYSSFGKVEAYFTAKSGKQERKVSILNDFSIYPELDQKTLNMSLLKPEMIQPPGTLRIMYKGLNKYNKHIFVDKTFTIDENGSATALLN
ncbi:MAG: fimbrial biogenesis chaperone [Pseudoalteromonas prydzensis]|uniref:fimbrial biogenesis chaperone n=1 Tax=Pseudoalteromonas prydzensis TaxID=182141 RepID=UPI003F9614FB